MQFSFLKKKRKKIKTIHTYTHIISYPFFFFFFTTPISISISWQQNNTSMLKFQLQAVYFLLLTLLLLFFCHCNVNSARSDLEQQQRGCGLIEECDDTTVAMAEDSVSNSRLLMMLQRRYISYATLLRDLVPCNRPGASYYNCRAPALANSYNRGCQIITRCARGY